MAARDVPAQTHVSSACIGMRKEAAEPQTAGFPAPSAQAALSRRGRAHSRLMVTRTEGSTPFRLVTHVGDVGHTLVVGPTGMGKSVLLATLMLQFRRYTGSRLFVFDKGGSARATVLGLGGDHYDLALEGGMAFQPLARIDIPQGRADALSWVMTLLAQEGLPDTPEVKEPVWSALGSLRSAPPEQRHLTGLRLIARLFFLLFLCCRSQDI